MVSFPLKIWFKVFPFFFEEAAMTTLNVSPKFSFWIFVRAQRTRISVSGTLISIVVFSCLSNVWFERKWIYNSWRTISSPSKHFDKISFWWRHWRGTSRTCRNIHEIDGKRTGLCSINYAESLTRQYNFGSGPFKIVPTCEILSWNQRLGWR